LPLFLGTPAFRISMQHHLTQQSYSQRLSRCYLTLAGAALLAFCSVCLPATPALVRTAAPDFALRSLQDKNIRLSEHLGEVVIINFWSTWCGPCRQQMPELDALYERYQRAGLVLLGINIDEQRDDAIEMAQTLKVRYPVLFDERKAVSRSYQVGSMPYTVLIDREGVVRYVVEGYRPGDVQRYTEQLRELLGE
jgi:peroxiredoxin